MKCAICKKHKRLAKVSGSAICKDCNRSLEADVAKEMFGGKIPSKVQAEWDKTWAQNRIPESEAEAKSDGCFPQGTAIATPTGELEITLVHEGDTVLAFDQRHNQLRNREVISVRKYERNTIWEISFDDGSRVRTTDHHRFWVFGAWTKASDIVRGDFVGCIDDVSSVVTRRVESSSRTMDTEVVYNLVVDGDYSFVADRVIAHSFSRFRTIQVLVWRARVAVRQLLPLSRTAPVRAGAR